MKACLSRLGLAIGLGLNLLAVSPCGAQLNDAPAALGWSGYAQRPEVLNFIDTMVVQHGFDRDALRGLFQGLTPIPSVLKAILPPPSPGARSWQAYRARLLDSRRVSQGQIFWRNHADLLHRASQQYAIPEEIIVAIIGVETFYGQNTGRYSALAALSTLAFDYPPRASLFLRELEALLLLAREQQQDPRNYLGSFAGALGMPQFLPSSIRNYAVDFDGDGQINLKTSVADAIGSVARFLALHGWQAGAPIADPARLSAEADWSIIDGSVTPRWHEAELRAHGIFPQTPRLNQPDSALIDLPTPGQATEYWLGYTNFYVLTRYNRSSFYAMTVFQLSEALKNPVVAAANRVTHQPKQSKHKAKAIRTTKRRQR